MHADLIMHSDAIFTGLENKTEPGAIAIKQGRIFFVGSLKEGLRLQGNETQVHDWGSSLIIPGFHDSHIHLFHSALYDSPLALDYQGESEQDCVQALAPLAARRAPGSWLLSQGWREYRWNPPRLPSKASLDAIYPDRPVAMYSGDAHTLWLNSCALRTLGLDRDSIPPQGGSYDRDTTGELTGIVRETAAMELMPRILASFSDEEIETAYRLFIEKLISQGITSICDMALASHPGMDFIRDDIYKTLEQKGELPLRVHLFPSLGSDLSRFETMMATMTGDRLRCVGLKQFFDGVSSQHTAYLAKPYTNARFPEDRGSLSIPFEAMRELVFEAHAKGYPVRIHTIGDEAIHLALDIFEDARGVYGPLPEGQHCLEHLENLQPHDIARLATLDILAAVQPPHITLDPGGPERDLGQDRIPYMWPFRTFLDQNVKLAFGTDSPVVSTNPFGVLYAAITRCDPTTRKPDGGWLPAQKITAAEALRAYTLGSAQASGRAHELGTIEVGKLADLAVLDRDILAIAPEDILQTTVMATYVDGTCVYRDTLH